MDLNDRIGRTEFVTKVKNIVNQLKPDNHICVAINGDWGSGKTFVMEMLDRSFTADRNCIVVRYDAWKNNFYSDPLIAILYCLLEGVEQYVIGLNDFSAVKESLKDSVKRIGSNILSAMAKSGGKLAVCAEVIRTIGSVATASIKITDNKNFDDFKSYQALLLQVQEQLNNLTVPSGNNDNVKLVVLVDELDRCLPNEQLIVLERLHHLFEVKNCAVIVALNQTCVIKTIQNMYGTSGHEYLRKFFDFTFKLPMSSDIYLKSILRDFISKGEKVINDTKSCRESMDAVYNCLKYGAKDLLNKVDNRDLSRYYECLQSICNEFGWDKLNEYYLFFIVMALFIRKHVSKTFLNEREIKEKQEVETQSNIYRTNEEKSLYYNFFDQYIGEQSVKLQRSFIELKINEKLYPANFNAIVAKSVDSVIEIDSEIIGSIRGNDYAKLRNLVLQYGGESEREEQ